MRWHLGLVSLLACFLLLPPVQAGIHPSGTDWTCHYSPEPGVPVPPGQLPTPDGCPGPGATLAAGDTVGFHNNDDPWPHLIEIVEVTFGVPTVLSTECIFPPPIGPGYSSTIFTVPTPTPPSTTFYELNWYEHCIPCPPTGPIPPLLTCSPTKTTHVKFQQGPQD